jgi:hypothetical protein
MSFRRTILVSVVVSAFSACATDVDNPSSIFGPNRSVSTIGEATASATDTVVVRGPTRNATFIFTRNGVTDRTGYLHVNLPKGFSKQQFLAMRPLLEKRWALRARRDALQSMSRTAPLTRMTVLANDPLQMARLSTAGLRLGLTPSTTKFSGNQFLTISYTVSGDASECDDLLDTMTSEMNQIIDFGNWVDAHLGEIADANNTSINNELNSRVNDLAGDLQSFVDDSFAFIDRCLLP